MGHRSRLWATLAILQSPVARWEGVCAASPSAGFVQRSVDSSSIRSTHAVIIPYSSKIRSPTRHLLLQQGVTGCPSFHRCGSIGVHMASSPSCTHDVIVGVPSDQWSSLSGPLGHLNAASNLAWCLWSHLDGCAWHGSLLPLPLLGQNSTQGVANSTLGRPDYFVGNVCLRHLPAAISCFSGFV